MNALATPLRTKPQEWEDTFLTWFGGRGALLFEDTFKLGGLSYYHFQSHFTLDNGRACSSFGSSAGKKAALLKCAAEAIERECMADFFRSQNNIPKAFQNSNGWAVHQSAESSIRSSVNEALERHLLLKSFFTYSWEGFNFYQKIPHTEVDIYLLTSRFIKGEKIAGIVLAKSPKHKGVSLGYCLGNIADLSKTSFWQSGIFEAIDKILFLDGKSHDDSYAEGSWIKEGIKYYLEAPFDVSSIENRASNPALQCGSAMPDSLTIDLQEKLRLDFPLYAAFSCGSEIIPLFSKARLDLEAQNYISPILSANGIAEIPQRHPIL